MSEAEITIPEDLLRELEALSQREGRSIIDILRDVLRLYVAEDEPIELPRFIGMASDGTFDASKDEDYLAEHWVRDIEASWAQVDPQS